MQTSDATYHNYTGGWACLRLNHLVSAESGKVLYSVTSTSLVPRPHPLRGERDLVNIDTFLGYVGGVVYLVSYSAKTDLHSDWSGQKCG